MDSSSQCQVARIWQRTLYGCTYMFGVCWLTALLVWACIRFHELAADARNEQNVRVYELEEVAPPCRPATPPARGTIPSPKLLPPRDITGEITRENWL